jgi:hypothetical protein
VEPAVQGTKLAMEFRDALAPVRLRHEVETRPTGDARATDRIAESSCSAAPWDR